MIGAHIVFGAYGFWLPNDPRGSGSVYVGSDSLFQMGPATKTTETRSTAHLTHDHEERIRAKAQLQRPAVRFNGLQAKDIGYAIGACTTDMQIAVWACAIMPDHVHLVVGTGLIHPRELVIRLKGRASQTLIKTGRHPFIGEIETNGRRPKCFARGEWSPFLHTSEDVRRAIEYVEQNPIKEGLPRQKWSFVKPFEEIIRKE